MVVRVREIQEKIDFEAGYLFVILSKSSKNRSSFWYLGTMGWVSKRIQRLLFARHVSFHNSIE